MGIFPDVQLGGHRAGSGRFKSILADPAIYQSTDLVSRYTGVIKGSLAGNGGMVGKNMVFIPIPPLFYACQNFKLAWPKPYSSVKRFQFFFQLSCSYNIGCKFIPKSFYKYVRISHFCLQKESRSFFVRPTSFIPMFL